MNVLESLNGRRCNGSGCFGRLTLPAYYEYGNQMLPFVSIFFFLVFGKHVLHVAVYTLIWNELHVVTRVNVSHSRTQGERETIQIDQMNPFDVDAVGMQLYMFRCSLCGMVA